jgi:polyisoprenoid-binding protein YceI
VNNPVKYTVAMVASVVAVGAVAVVAVPIVSRSASLDTGATMQQVVPTVFDSPDETLTGSDSATSWHLDPSSTVGYRVSTSDGDVAAGHTSELSGVVMVSGSRLTDAEFMVDLSTLVSDNESRDALLRTLVFATGGNSTASFVLTEPVDLPEAPDASDASAAPDASADDSDDDAFQTVEIVGDLTVRGVTNEVRADMQLDFDHDSGAMTGSIPVDLAAYGIQVPDFGVVDLDDTAFIDVDLTASPSN